MPEFIKKLTDFGHFCHIHSLLSKQEALLWLLSPCAERATERVLDALKLEMGSVSLEDTAVDITCQEW